MLHLSLATACSLQGYKVQKRKSRLYVLGGELLCKMGYEWYYTFGDKYIKLRGLFITFYIRP